MTRLPRSALPDGIYHAFAHSVAEAPLFRDDDDRRYFLAVFAIVVRRFDWELHAFCLMGNHYHLIIETSQPRLSNGLQYLNGRYGALQQD